jgi:NADP-reducing hydrogenase subunit HndB
MKSLKELEEIRNKTLSQIDIRKKGEGTRIVVGMATCGIAAGARPVLSVMVSQTGCIGACRLEPMVEVYTPGNDKVTYVKVMPDMVSRIVAEHIVNGNPVTEFTIGYYEANNDK